MEIKYLLVILGLFLIIDIPMISIINGKMYYEQFKRINREEIKIGHHTYLSAIFAYLLLTIGIYNFIVKPEIKKDKIDYLSIFINGMILGLVIYGIYNGTNMATINEWGMKEFIIDTTWGTLLSGILSILSIFIIKNYI